MTETIFLIADAYGIKAFRKTLPDVRRGEIPLKLTITVPKEAFNPPALSKEVVIEDWRQGIELEDVEFRHNIITEAEAEQIRQSRLKQMEAVLKAQGYTVTKPEKK